MFEPHNSLKSGMFLPYCGVGILRTTSFAEPPGTWLVEET
jgi:hypothetical protein